MEKILVIGIGNVARGDDGLGWAFLEGLEGDERFELQYRYQLQIEDAELVSRFGQVWFVDASQTLHNKGFIDDAPEPLDLLSYTSHALPPASILKLCQDIYGDFPEAHVLEISGHQWELGSSMSQEARENLINALAYFLDALGQREKQEIDG